MTAYRGRPVGYRPRPSRGRVQSGFALGLLVGGGIVGAGVILAAVLLVAWFAW